MTATPVAGRSPDPAPQALAAGTPRGLADDLAGLVAPERVLTRAIDLVRFASDASVYRLLPRVVVLADGEEEIRRLFAYSRRTGVPLTFRSAGTSLCGQAQTDGILVEVQRFWRGVEVLDGGARVRVRPGTIAGRVNAALKPYQRKIGPDPASVQSCTVGGIIANNSSGMCCGVAQNAYHTLASLRFVLPSGTTIDTAAPDAAATLTAREPALAAGLLALRGDLLADRALAERVRAKYRMKNTTGYGLNALLDYDTPLDILAHLLVGSEGTLAFVAEVTLQTVPDDPHRLTGLLLFADLYAACEAIAPLRAARARAVELFDSTSLRAVAHLPGVPPEVATLPAGAAALLVEFATAEEAGLPGLREVADAATAALRVSGPVAFTDDAAVQARYWTVRQGLIPSVGAARPSGTSVILEDVTLPVDHLADGVVALTALLARHGYPDAGIFGHAKDGNLHFLLTQRFDADAEVRRFGRFMTELADLVTGHGGALKGEHGTGRNMAPFVETEWGPEAVALMRRLKDLVDPERILNPGVILNDSPTAHLEHLKSTPTAEPEVDRCIECGFCEKMCPSRELTTTPRQRIVLRREILRQRSLGGRTPMLDALEREYAHDVVETCAGDGMCQLACPVGIDTGALVRRHRHEGHAPAAEQVARRVAAGWGLGERMARVAVRSGRVVARAVGDRPLVALTTGARRLGARELLPHWLEETPRPAPRLPRTSRAGAAAVYLPSCVNRVFGADADQPVHPSLPEAFVAVARRAGWPLWIPPDVAGVCCGTPWHSKGYHDGDAAMARRVVRRAYAWTAGGRLPLVTDASSCAHGLRGLRPRLVGRDRARYDALTILDSVDAVHAHLLPRLRVRSKLPSVAVHPTCAVHHAGAAATLEAVAAALADEVYVPPSTRCCAFAGDRGFLHPELTASATAPMARELAARKHAAYLSSNRTCEIGMRRGTGRPYRSFLHLLEELTRRRAS